MNQAEKYAHKSGDNHKIPSEEFDQAQTQPAC